MNKMNEETELLESAIAKGDAAIYEAQAALNNLHRKQYARRQELGYQKAMAGLKLARVSETPVEGAAPVIVQTDAGISTRWITPNK